MEIPKKRLLLLFLLIGCGSKNNLPNTEPTHPNLAEYSPPPTIISVVEIGHVPSLLEAMEYPFVSVLIPLNASNLGRTAFGVNPLVVPKGTILKWVNNDVFAHSTVSVDGYWNSLVLYPGNYFSFLFLEPGDYQYRSQGLENISGTIRVAP